MINQKLNLKNYFYGGNFKTNAKLLEISPQLVVLGYNEAKLNKLLGKLIQLETLN